MLRQKSSRVINCQKDKNVFEDNEVVAASGAYFFKKYRSKLLVILFFVVLFGVGLFFLPNVNGNFDENVEQNILLSNVKDYAELLHIDEVVSGIHGKGILAISVDPNRDHGVAPYYFFAPVLIMKDKYPHIVSVLWHFYTFCLAFIGVIFFYLLIQYMTKNRKISVLMTLFYYFTPRIFIDSMHNNKDIVFMALIVAMLYFGIRLIKEKQFRWAVLFALFGAFVCNIKILGLFFVGIIGLGYVVGLTVKRDWTRRNFLCGFTAAVMVFCLYLVLTPAIWGDGHFALIEYIQYCLGNAVNFSADTSVVFEGTIYRHSDNPLPWYYLPKLILITLPITVVIMFVISSVLIILDIIRDIKMKKIEFISCILLMVLGMFLIPLSFAIFSNPNLYNGWRHFYFLYSLMMIVGSYALLRLKDYKKTSLIMTIFVCATIFSNLVCLLRYGTANTAYYNFLVGGGNLAGIYELDYYNVSSQEALKKFLASGKLEENKDGMLYLYASGFGEVVIGDMKTYITPKIGQRIVLVTDSTMEKNRKEGKIIYNMSNPVYRYNDVSNYELVYSYKMFDSEVINFYKVD